MTKIEEPKPSVPLIYQKLVAIMKDTGVIAKTEKNQAQGFMFRGIDNVMNELHELFAKHSVFITTMVTDCKTEQYTAENNYNGQIKSTIWTTTRATCEFHFFAEDGSSVKSVVIGEGKDSADKSMNKALSVALKYALLQMFLIPTAEKKDPDYDYPETTTEPGKAEQILLKQASKAANECKNVEDLKDVWAKHPSLQRNAAFAELIKKLNLKLSNGN